MRPDLKETITQLGLEFRLMTQFTSFIAVEEMVVTDGGQPRRIDVPVEVPEGMNRGAIYGDDVIRVASPQNLSSFYLSGVASNKQPARVARTKDGRAMGVGSGQGGGMGGGVGPTAAATPVPKARPSKESVSVTAMPELLSAGSGRRYQLSPEEEKRRQLIGKADQLIVALIDRLKQPDSEAAPEESRFVTNGKAELQIWLTEKSESTIAQLKSMGLEVMFDSKASTLVIGRIPTNKLEALIELKFVRYVAPLRKN
jgi:hypothetical protein